MDDHDAECCCDTAGDFLMDDFMRRNLGDRHLASEVATIFRDSAPKYVASINSALSAVDAPALSHAAHKLKGVASNLSMPHISAIAEKFEIIAKTGELARAADLLPELEQKLEQGLAALQKLLLVPHDKNTP